MIFIFIIINIIIIKKIKMILIFKIISIFKKNNVKIIFQINKLILIIIMILFKN
jgi:hypothetical protein